MREPQDFKLFFSPYRDNDTMPDNNYENQGFEGDFGGRTYDEGTMPGGGEQFESGDTRQFDSQGFPGENEPFQADRTIIMGKRKDALAWLIKIENLRIVKRYRLKEEQTSIGRDTRCDIVIDDSEISESHAKIIQDEKNYKLIDMGSLNSTFVNGKKITAPRKLEDGDEIIFASKKFIFKKIK
jgi:FOG: FHA domain